VDCLPNVAVINNRSTISGSNDYHGFIVVATGHLDYGHELLRFLLYGAMDQLRLSGEPETAWPLWRKLQVLRPIDSYKD